MTEKLLLIGCGNMAGAMLAGWLAAGEEPSRFEVLSRSPKDLPDGVVEHLDPAEVGGHDAFPQITEFHHEHDFVDPVCLRGRR